IDATTDAPTAEACPLVCSAGATQCRNGSLVSCAADANGCAAWSAPVACGPNSTCRARNGKDACVCDLGYAPGNGACTLARITPPRPVAPLSTATATSHAPVFRWALPPGVDGAMVEICSDRACAHPVTAFPATGSSGAPPIPLAKG